MGTYDWSDYSTMTRAAAVTISVAIILCHIDTMDIKGCICHFAKWLIHPFISMVEELPYVISIPSVLGFLSAIDDTTSQ